MSGTLHERLRTQFGECVGDLVASTTPFFVVKAEALREVAVYGRNAGFDTLNCLSAVDAGALKPPDPEGPGFWVAYHVESTSSGERASFKVRVSRDDPRLPSVARIWPVADWHEREAYDMFGIRFEGHPRLERLLCPADWSGWPLRKDYAAPAEYDGVTHARAESGGSLADSGREP